MLTGVTNSAAHLFSCEAKTASLRCFPALVVLRRKHPDVPRPYRVPGGMAGAWAAAIISQAFVVVTAVTLLWPGAINAWFGQSYSVQARIQR